MKDLICCEERMRVRVFFREENIDPSSLKGGFVGALLSVCFSADASAFSLTKNAMGSVVISPKEGGGFV